MKKIARRPLAALAMLIALTAGVPASHAQARCPWLNAATAAGLLGGEVRLSVSAPVDPGPIKGVGQASYPDQVRLDRFDTVCTFTRNSATLTIAVKTMKDAAHDFPPFLAACAGSTQPLTGIGNEAVQCLPAAGNGPDRGARKASTQAGPAGQAQEQVIGRVRDRAFVLTLRRNPASSGSSASSGSPTSAALRDDTRNIAEQVAGSLF